MSNTINVTIRAIDQNGQPLAHAPISARLTNLEVTQDLGYVIQESTATIADANGVAVMALWPNALGSTESSYKFTIRNPNNWQIETIIATLPNNDCELHNVADLPAYPGKTDGQLAVEEAIAAVAPALAAKTAAEAAAIEAGLSATEAAENAAITSSFNITIGTVTEGNAAATITGITPNRVLNLVIPKGDKGDTGLQGIQGTAGINGINGLNGSDGADGVDGLDGKSAYQLAVDSGFVGTLNQWILSLKGDKGDKGGTGNTGLTGDTGLTGADGKSAYQVALDNGFVGTLSAWLASLVGPQGPQGIQGIQGIPGNNGTNGVDGTSFTVDATGLLANRSAYDSEAAGFAYLATDTGNLYIRQGASGWSAAIPFGKGETGAQGIQGPAGLDGTDGTNGTNGVDGADGLSAYQIAVNAGFVGNEAAWLLSLKGETGAAGINGINGTNGTDGVDGIDGTNGINGANGLSAYQIAVNNGFVGNEAAWLASLEGPAGPAGADGIDGADGAPGTTTWAGITDKPTFAAVATSGLKADVGLGNVDNTSDANKPVSNAQATANALVASNASTDATTKANTAQANAIAASAPITHVGSGGSAHANVVSGGASGFMTGTDKTKLDGIAAGANNYTHPATHSPSIIVQDASNRFVSDIEKAAWNAKQPAGSYATGTGTADGTNTGDETAATIKSKLGISTLTGSNTGDQVIPTTLPASDVYAWAKAATKPTYTASEVGLGNVNNTADTDKPVSTATQAALDGKQASASKDAANGYVGLTSTYQINFKNNAGTFTSILTNASTGARVYTFPNKDGTVAMLSDITDTTVVENVLTSTSTVNALSAAQGKVLKDTLDTITGTASNTGAYYYFLY